MKAKIMTWVNEEFDKADTDNRSFLNFKRFLDCYNHFKVLHTSRLYILKKKSQNSKESFMQMEK